MSAPGGCHTFVFAPSPRPSLHPRVELRTQGYDPSNGDPGAEDWIHGNPIQSPVFAPDDVLQRLPPTCIQVGGYDPLLDDSVDFNTRIRRLGIPGELRIYRSLPHTFVSFPHWHLMPEVHEAMAQASSALTLALTRACCCSLAVLLTCRALALALTLACVP